MEKSSGLSYFDLDRLYTECVERNFRGESNTIGQVISQATYALCWNSFVKWSQSQIELNRAINIGSFGTIGFQAIRENVKIVYIKLADPFLQQNGIGYKKGQLELESQQNIVMGPTVKPNYAAMSKTGGVDKQILQSSLSNIFQLIGQLLQEGQNTEIDLQEFGKFSSINRQVIYAPLNKQKPTAFQGKQTVKSLMDLGSSAKHASGKLEALPAQTTSKMMASGTYQMQGSMFKSSIGGGAQNESPTRRFRKPHGEGKITSDLLGAGDDPMAKNQEFSLLANDPAKLMQLSFKKPTKALSRYPPVIDPFSRTLAAPISSQRHYFSVCHRIGTNFTASAKGFYIDTDMRSIKYKDVNDTGTKLDIVSNEDVEPADEQEEYDGLMNPKQADKKRIMARKVSYQRYRQYVENEISVDVIAPIRQYWLSHIIELIPGDLHAVEKDKIEFLIDTMLNEINKDYFDSVRKSILDYILKDDNEMRRLGIQQVLNQPIDWGDDFYKGIEPNEEWKHNVMMARMLMSENLCICSQATLELMKLWQEYENYFFVKLPQPREEPVILMQFLEQQENQMNKVKGLLASDWNKSAVDILREELENLDKDQTKTFFESVATLMANQVRDLITKSVKSYVEFFKRFEKKKYPTPEDIIAREYGPDVEFEDSFLILKLTVESQKITFSDPINYVLRDLLKIITLIVQNSSNLPRPENTIARSDKMHLWDVTIEDDLVKNAQSEITQILENNLNTAEMAIHVYDKYLFILKEKNRIEAFLQEPKTFTRENVTAEIERYEATIKEIRETMPYEIRMNMFLIDCVELNNRLCSDLEELILKVLSRVAEFIFQERSTSITHSVKQIADDFNLKADTTKKLVAMEKQLEEIKIIKKNDLIKDFKDMVDWLVLLYSNPRYEVPDEQTKSVHMAYNQAQRIMVLIEQQENRLKNDHLELENGLMRQIRDFRENLEEIKTELDKFKEYTNIKKEDDYNRTIATMNSKLSNLQDEMVRINDQEVDFDMTVTEYPLLNDLSKNIKPYEELWKLVKENTTKQKEWKEGVLLKLNPEDVEKDHKQLWSTANKLLNKFKEGETKAPKLEPVVRTIVKDLQDMREYIPIIRALCNPGLEQMHWREIKQVTEFEVNELTQLSQIGRQFIVHKDKLEEISDTASKQFSNARTYNKMIADWEPMEYTCKEYKGCTILDGEAVELIQALLDDHIIKTQSMKGSPYAQVIIDKLLKWETDILTTQENLDVWLKVQSQWLYLEPVFSSEDIMKQMPVEGTKFREVDRAWKAMMSRIQANPKALDVMRMEELGDILKESHAKLEQVSKGLNDYLESKRGLFPRFCFLSDGELLEILSETKEPLRVQPHLKKCFEGIAALEFDEEKKIHAMYSSEGEQVPFTRIIDPIASKGQVEDWLRQVEEIMIKSVKEIVEKSLQDYAKKDRERWVTSWQGQAVLAISMVYWTREAEEAMKKGGVAGLHQYHEKLDKQLKGIVALVRTNIGKLDRATLEALIVLDVHAKDVIQNDLIKNNVSDASDFNWLAQLRYYWEDNNLLVRIINAELGYNYEYLGNSARLVITPLTDRCYRTLCGALFLNYGGAPEGPAGTGKTETVKDLSKALARQCIVFNCSDGLDYLQMAKFFKGLASCGAWSCFDEFNRIELEVLSVIAQQLHTIQHAIDKKMEKFDFEGTVIPLKFTCNCFITMNPGYAGRSELPDNLKVLFRSVAMMVPDYGMIAEISLYSFGFNDAKSLSGKIVTTYKLCSEQLSSQDHYDYGMRAVKSVLTAAGNLKRKFVDEDESILMLRAINDVNLAKFLSHDLPLFKNITSDLFPGIVIPTPDYRDMINAMKNCIERMNLQGEEYFIDKCIQLYEMIVVRHGLMIVGLPFAGKTSALKVLAGALSELAEKGQMGEMKTHICQINPKSISMGQLYGNFDDVSHDWSDGILAVWYRVMAAQMDKRDRRWLVFDGPVDAIWIENMNTVLDDNKKLCLMSGEIIQMSENMNMIFEPMDLAVASPATVSRCGMVYMEPHQMGWRPLFNSWKTKLPACFHDEHIKVINELVDVVIQPCITFIRTECHETTPTQDQNLVQSLLRIWRCLLKVFDNENFITTLDKKAVASVIESCFVFSCIWSICISINTEFRKPFDQHFKKVCNGDLETMTKKLNKKILPTIFDRGTVYDYQYFAEKNEWKHWMDQVNKETIDQFPKNSQVQDIIVTTVDTIRYQHMQEFFIIHNIPSLFVGPTGTGKSAYIMNVLLTKLNRDKFMTIEVGFSAQTSANQVQDIVDQKLKKKKKDHFGPPKFEQRCVIFVDDLNMPKKENYGAQPPIEILRQLIDQGGWYDRKDNAHPFRNIVDTMLITAMGPPGGGKSFITPRFQRHFNVVAFANFDSATMEGIFKTILKWYFRVNNFNAEVAGMDQKLVQGTSKVYVKIQEELKPTPLKSHYTFNLRDFSKVICGICMAGAKQVPNTDVVTRLWAHEVIRVFGDRLINDEDRLWMLNCIRDTVRAPFASSFDTVFQHLDNDKNNKVETLDEIRGLIFGDVLTPFGMPERPYEEIQDREKLQACCEEALSQYNMMSEKPMELVLFSFALEHLIRIGRILKQPGGHAMLVGVGGSGRQSLSRLASKITDYEVYQVEIKKNYRMQEWRDDMKNLLRQCGGKGVLSSFVFTDIQIKEEGFLEDVNNILNTGEIPNLFPEDEKQDVIEMVRNAAKQDNRAPDGTNEQLFGYFIERCKKRLHIILCFSPIGESFRGRVRNFPSLVNCTTIDWFSEWPRDALQSVANRFLADVEMEPAVRQSCVGLVQWFHESTAKASAKFKDELRRHNYVTPTSYLELITTFKTILKEKREEVMAMKNRYQHGYNSLISTESNVSKMQKELEDLQPKLIEASKETEIKEKIVETQANDAEKIREVVAGEEAIAQKAADEATEIKVDCEKELGEAMPILNKAMQALDCITPGDISYVRALPQPPEDVRMVMSAVCVLMGEKAEGKMDPATQKKVWDFWPTSKKLLQQSDFLKKLTGYDTNNIPEDRINKLQDIIKNPKFEIAHLKTISEIASNLAMWVLAMNKVYAVNLVVKPKQIKLAQANEKYAGVSAQLKIKQDQLKVVQDKVDALRRDLKETKDFKAELEAKVLDCEQKLDRAQKLISGLGGEKTRWNEQSIILGGIYKNLTGDVLVASGMIAYLGAFTSVFRSELAADWVSKCLDQNIPNSGKFSLSGVLGNAVLIRKWNICGLPSDAFSIENAIVTQKARRWPLFIDPQGQANKWIRNLEKEREIKIMKFSDGNYLKILENSIRMGYPVLMENVYEEMDPAIEPLLQKQIFKKGNSLNIRLGDSTIEYAKDFKFYMTTKLRNPHYLPEVSTKVTLLNFMITYEGLSDQLLGIVVEKENSDLQVKKEQLVVEGAANKDKLEQIEEQILQVLSKTTDILGDSKAIEILSNAKILSNDIAKKQEIAEKTEKEIDEMRMMYRPVAERTAGLFFCITDLANIDPMYQYSLGFFIQLFIGAIANSMPSEDIQERLGFLNEEFLISLYRNICRSLFEKDKIIFSFLLTCKLNEMKGTLDAEEFRFLLTGGVSLGEEMPHCNADWLAEKSWGEIFRMSKLKNFHGFLDHFQAKHSHYKQLYDSAAPQDFKIHEDFVNRLNSFQKMIILRCLRPDKVVPQMFSYIVEQLGEQFITPPAFDLGGVYKDSISTTPLIFVLSPGADPLNSLVKFAEAKKKAFETVSLGQGQGPKAERFIADAVQKGSWVVLQNCHLAVSWMGKLEKICEDLSPDHKVTNREFRLWLTSYPSKDFPVSILQNGIKMTNEPPKGLRSNVAGSYMMDPISNMGDFFKNCVKPREFRKLIFGLCFFHAIIQERVKFGPLGWNIPYSFNDSDLIISVKQLRIFLNQYPEKTPFDALKYLTGECNYGGRVTDDKDRRLLMTILEDYYNEKMFDDNYKLSPSGVYYAPPHTEYDNYIEYIKNLPQYPETEVFGLHANADITKDKNETNNTFEAILSTQENTAGGGGGNSDEFISKLADSILIDVPEPFDVKAAELKYPVSYEQSMNTVLTQELIRFNGLINIIRSSLKDLKKAIKGEILLSAQLEDALKSLFDGKVPQLWKSKSYPSLKPLEGYVKDLKSRLEFFQTWIINGVPQFFWINKFFFTQGFLTGAMQNYARKYKIAIDQLTYDYEMVQEENPPAPEDGINVYGMFIEGCKWNYHTRLLDESDPKILFVKCPMIWFKPCTKEEVKNYPNYNCPVYKTSERKGTLSTTGHSTNFVAMIRLPSDKPQSHWIKRGVAMLCSLDD